MNEERRKDVRVAGPFDGRWRGAAGAGQCRIADISYGGCFVETLAVPAAGEQTVLTINIGSGTITLVGHVVYSVPSIGFAVQFSELSEADREQFDRLLAETRESSKF